MSYLSILNLYKDQTILQMKEVWALEKVHGTSAHVSYKIQPDLSPVPPHSVVKFFSGGEKHEKFCSLFDINDLFVRFIALGHTDVTVYGEAYGGSCQKMAATYGPDLRFIAFDVLISRLEFDKLDPCPQHIARQDLYQQSVIQNNNILQKDSVTLVIKKTLEQKEVLNKQLSVLEKEANTVKDIGLVTKKLLFVDKEDVIFEQNLACPSKNTTQDLNSKKESVASVNNQNLLKEEEEIFNHSQLITITNQERFADSYVEPVISAFKKQTITEDGLKKQRCTCKKIETWLDVPDAADVTAKLGLEFVPYDRVTTDLTELDRMRDLPSEVAMRRGMGNDKAREGVVLRPLTEMTDKRGNRIICKHKNAMWNERATPQRVVDPNKMIVLRKAEAIADEWVVENRLSNVLSKLPEAVDMSHTSMVIKAMIADVRREASGEIVESEEAMKQIARKTAELYKKRVTSIKKESNGSRE